MVVTIVALILCSLTFHALRLLLKNAVKGRHHIVHISCRLHGDALDANANGLVPMPVPRPMPMPMPRPMPRPMPGPMPTPMPMRRPMPMPRSMKPFVSHDLLAHVYYV